MFVLEVDEELTLRMLSIRDAEALFKLIDQSRDYLKEWLPWVAANQTISDSEKYIKESFYTYANQKDLRAGIFLNSKLVGVLGFNEIDLSNRIATIGYWLGQSYQKQGIMTRSVAALLHYGFYTLNLNRIEIRAAVENRASQLIPERLNFKKEGHLRQVEWLNTHYVDHYLYGLLKEDYESK